MSIITDSLPNYIAIRDIKYPIHTDFRTWIKISEIFSSRRISDMEKAVLIISMCYKKLPPNMPDALNGAAKFYSGGIYAKRGSKSDSGAIYDFEYDSGYIYSAFYSQYGLDLAYATLHWWQFKALFSGLDRNCMFMQIAGYRAADLSAIKDAGQKRFYRKMKSLFRLPAAGRDDYYDDLEILF